MCSWGATLGQGAYNVRAAQYDDRNLPLFSSLAGSMGGGNSGGRGPGGAPRASRAMGRGCGAAKPPIARDLNKRRSESVVDRDLDTQPSEGARAPATVTPALGARRKDSHRRVGKLPTRSEAGEGPEAPSIPAGRGKDRCWAEGTAVQRLGRARSATRERGSGGKGRGDKDNTNKVRRAWAWHYDLPRTAVAQRECREGSTR